MYDGSKNKYKTHTFCERWIEDGIKDDYKTWCSWQSKKNKGSHSFNREVPMVFIESPTGTGKSTFIFNKLLPHLAYDENRYSHNILYVSNRDALKMQINNNLSSLCKEDSSCLEEMHLDTSKFKLFKYSDGESYAHLYITNYQSLLGWFNTLETNNLLFDIEFVVLDEAHFFLEDSLFNSFTDMIFKKMYNMFILSVFIFMSATLDETIEWLSYQNLFRQKLSIDKIGMTLYNPIFYKNNYRYGQYKLNLYANYDRIIQQIKNTPQNEKWIIFVSSKSTGKTLSKNIAEQTGKKVRFISAETKNRSIWNEIIENSSFRGDILITTKVLDNGINITDERVRHIVIPFCAKSDFIQMLGRKRIINTESVNVYAEIPSEAKLRSYIKETSHKTEVLHNILYILPHTDNYGIIIRRNLQNLWLNCDKSINKLFFIDNECRLCPNTAAYTKLKSIQSFYEEVYQNICDTDKYIKTISSWIPGELSPDTTFLDSVSGKSNRTIDEFIDCYKNKLLEPNSVYDEFIRIYKSECSKIYSGDELKSKLNLKKAKNIRKSTINNALTILEKPYKVIKSNCKWKIVEKE